VPYKKFHGNLFDELSLNKGTWSRDRFQNNRQKLKDLGPNKWRGRFLNLSGVPSILCKKASGKMENT
jgi:hypothetical protein